METKKLSDLKVGDLVILHTDDTRYEDREMFIKSIGPKWIILDEYYRGVKFSVKDGTSNDKLPGYHIFIPQSPEEQAWEKTYSYLIMEVAPRYLKTLSLDKLRYLERRWTKKILENDENNSTI